MQAVADAGHIEDGQGSAVAFGQGFGLFQGLQGRFGTVDRDQDVAVGPFLFIAG